jgi:hypothetical protein
MTELVVHTLERVDVEHQDGDGHSTAAAPFQFRVETCMQIAPVEHRGERIDRRCVRKFIAQFGELLANQRQRRQGGDHARRSKIVSGERPSVTPVRERHDAERFAARDNWNRHERCRLISLASRRQAGHARGIAHEKRLFG